MSNNNSNKIPEPQQEGAPEQEVQSDYGDRLSDRLHTMVNESIATAAGITTPRNEGQISGTVFGVRDERNCEAPCDTRSEAEPLHISPVKIRDVVIKQLDFGYIIKVGCQSFAIESPERLVEALTTYLKDPVATEKDWFAGNFLKNK